MNDLPQITIYRAHDGRFVASYGGGAFFDIKPPLQECGCCEEIWYYTKEFEPTEVWRSGDKS